MVGETSPLHSEPGQDFTISGTVKATPPRGEQTAQACAMAWFQQLADSAHVVVSKSKGAKHSNHPQREQRADWSAALHDPCSEVAHRSDLSPWTVEVGATDQVEHGHRRFRERPVVPRENLRAAMRPQPRWLAVSLFRSENLCT